jgi:hypothetical protein
MSGTFAGVPVVARCRPLSPLIVAAAGPSPGDRGLRAFALPQRDLAACRAKTTHARRGLDFAELGRAQAEAAPLALTRLKKPCYCAHWFTTNRNPSGFGATPARPQTFAGVSFFP